MLDELGVALGRTLGLPHLPGHFQTIVVSFLAFTLVYLASAIASPFIAPRTYPRLSRRTKHSWNVHAVSMVHAMIIGPMATYKILTMPEASHIEKAFGWNESVGRLHAIAVGYFIWDTIESVLARAEIGFVIHGLACGLIFCLTYSPFMGLYGPSALIWELSTPFLNIHWYLDKLQMTGGRLQAINGFILLVMFFVVRICYGFYMSSHFFRTLFAVWDMLPFGLALTYVIGNLVLNMLNVFWFTKMIAAIRKRFGKGLQGAKSSNGHATPNEKQE